MTPLELLFGFTVLRGALAVLGLLAAERLLRHRLSPGCRRLLWVACIVSMLIPQSWFSGLPLRIDLSGLSMKPAALSMAASSDGLNRATSGHSSGLRERTPAQLLQLHRRKLGKLSLVLIPLPALLFLLFKYGRCRCRVRCLPPVTDARTLAVWGRIIAEHGPLRFPVVLLDGDPMRLGPTIFGCFRRWLLLPVEELRKLPESDLELLLEHEYHHSRAGDAFLNAFTLVLWALAWYNPFVSIARRKVRSSCELECDRRVLTNHPRAAREYGNLLLRFASGSTPSAMTIGLAESPRELERRIREIAHEGRYRYHRSAGRAAALLLGLLLVSPLCLVAVNAWPGSVRKTVKSPEKPLLPFVTLRIQNADGDRLCWKVGYSDNFPFEKSELVLGNGRTRLAVKLTSRPEVLVMHREGDALALVALSRPEDETLVLPESSSEVLILPGRKQNAFVPGAAIELQIAGIDEETLGQYRIPEDVQ